MSDEDNTFVAYVASGAPAPLVPAPAARDWMSRTQMRFAHHCLPMLLANQHGWHLLNTTGFVARWSGGEDPDAVRIAHDEPGGPVCVGSHFGHGILTWTIPYLFRTPPGHDLLVRGPANFPKDAVAPLEGLVEADWASATFTMNWQITRPAMNVRFAVGEPVCLLVPQRRGALEALVPVVRPLSDDEALSRRHQAFTESRAAFIADRTRGFQLDYFGGRHAEGTAASEHRRRLNLAAFSLQSAADSAFDPSCKSVEASPDQEAITWTSKQNG